MESNEGADINNFIDQQQKLLDKRSALEEQSKSECRRLEAELLRTKEDLLSAKTKRDSGVSLMSKIEKELRDFENEIWQTRQEEFQLTREIDSEANSKRLNKNLEAAEAFIRDYRPNIPGIHGLLYSLLYPLSTGVETALLAVLGDSLTTTLVCSTRDDALASGDVLKTYRTGIKTIDIAEETGHIPLIVTEIKGCSPLVNHVRLENELLRPVVTKRLSSWLLFQGDKHYYVPVICIIVTRF